jgi:hypothetical protein
LGEWFAGGFMSAESIWVGGGESSLPRSGGTPGSWCEGGRARAKALILVGWRPRAEARGYTGVEVGAAAGEIQGSFDFAALRSG